MNKNNQPSFVVPVASDFERIRMAEMLKNELTPEQFAYVVIEVRPDLI
ncbi:hypothetical protein PQR14_26905 [Paraburkholderia bryophila]